MKFIIAALAFGLVVGTARAADIDYSASSPDQLIDALILVDCRAPGLDGFAEYSAFIADSAAPRFHGGLLGQAAPCIPPQMRELVRHGTDSLAALLAHLEDSRPTKLIVGGDIKSGGFYLFQKFKDEYDPRQRQSPEKSCDARCVENFLAGKNFTGKYTVKVGDVCFALIGEIVDRNLVSVRYQPTGGLAVNSPIENPQLAQQVRKDWKDLDAAGLRSSLLKDLDDADRPYLYEPPLVRLRFYFPQTYAFLTGEELVKRNRFEDGAKPDSR